MKSFDEKLYIYETCHKHLYKNEILCQAVCNKMALDPIPDQLKYFKKIEKVLLSKRIFFKKIAIMHGKGEFSKIKGSLWDILIEASSICNILPRPAVSSGLIAVKLKRISNAEVMYILNQIVHTLYIGGTYLKSHNKFYKDISIEKGLSSEDMFKFSDIAEMQVETESDTENLS